MSIELPVVDVIVFHCPDYHVYRVAQNIGNILYALSSSNISRFLTLFHRQNLEKICNNTITEDPTTPQVCRYTTL